MTREAGWYDDPQDPNTMRYWDGVQWTNHTSPKYKPNLGSSSTGSPPQQQAGAEGSQGQYGGQQGQYGGTQSPGGQQGQGGQYGGQQGQGGQYGGQQGQYGQGQQNPYAPQQNPYGQQQGPYGQQQGYQYGQQQGGWGTPMPGGYGEAYATGPTTPDGQPLAGWWIRLLARIIDGILFGIVVSIVGFQLVAPDLMQDFQSYVDSVLDAAEAGSTATPAVPEEINSALLRLGLFNGIAFLVYELLMVKFLGGTLGKLITGLRVRLRDQPGPLPWSAAGIRSGVWAGPGLISGVGLLGTLASLFTLLNGLWPLWDPKKQAIHDKVAKTNVVKRRR
jgi:uncharacterized RDD family membrane protein YckC